MMKKYFSRVFIFILILSILPVPTLRADDSAMTIDEYLGTDRESLLAWLGQHEKDAYYFGTPYYWSDLHPWSVEWAIRPNGRFAGNDPMMNCTGFVADVFLQSGVSSYQLEEMVSWVKWNANYDGGGYIDAFTWFYFVTERDDILYYHFDTIEEALTSGVLRKGDLIYFQPVSTNYYFDSYGNVVDCHFGFFWGDASGDDKFWHSHPGKTKGYPGGDQLSEGNQMSQLVPCSESTVYVFPLSESWEPEEEVTPEDVMQSVEDLLQAAAALNQKSRDKQACLLRCVMQ